MNPKQVERFYLQFGQNITKARKRLKKLSQEQLGKIIGLSRTSVVNIERGRQRIQVHMLIQIAQALNLSPADLIPPSPLETEGLPKEVTSMVSSSELPAVVDIIKSIQEEQRNGNNNQTSQRVARKRKDRATPRTR